jgi:hypothetical protein
MGEISKCALRDGGSHAGRRSCRQKRGNRPVYHRVWTLHAREEKNRQDAEDCHYSQFASDVARDH